MVTLESVGQSLWAWIVTFLNQLIPVYILPNLQLIIQIVILLIAAYIVGKISKIVVTKILSVVGFKRITSKTWAESILRVTGYRGTIVGLIGDLVKWLIYILFLAVIIQTLGLPGVADLFTQVATFLPRFIGAILIIAIGFIIADFFGKIFEEASKKILEEEILSKLTGGLIRYSIALVTIIMALGLIGLDASSLTVLFAAVLATIIVVLLIGIKDIFPNFTAGLSLKKTLKIGEKIKLGQYSGQVEKIDEFSVTLKTRDKHITIPNSMFLKNPIERNAK